MNNRVIKHIAPDANSSLREQRFVCFKKDEESVLTPELRALDIAEEHTGDGTIPETLLEELRAARERGELNAYILENRDRILLTAKGNDAVWRLKKMLDGEIPASAEDIFRTIETLFRKNVKPEDDDTLKQMMEQTRREVAALPEGQEQSRWALFLETVREFGQPVYTRLGEFLTHPLIRERHTFSIDRSFEDFRKPGKRLALMQELSEESVRKTLVLERSHPLAERRRALDDLFSFLTHAYPLLGSEERAEFYASYCRVGAAVAVLEEEAAREAKGKASILEIPSAEEYGKKREHLSTFLRNDEELRKGKPGWMGSSSGWDSFTKRLQNEDDFVFQYLRRGLEAGGWIQELHLSQGEEYLCTRITLEEINELYGEIAEGRMSPQEPHSLLHHVRETFLAVVRKKDKGEKLQQESGKRTLQWSNPLAEAEALENMIHAKIEKGETPSSAEVNELLLLVAWVEGTGLSYPLSGRGRKELRDVSEKGVEGYRREAADACAALEPLAESRSVRWNVRDLAEKNFSRHAERTPSLSRGQSKHVAGSHQKLLTALASTQDPLEEKTFVQELLMQGDHSSLISALRAIREEKLLFLDPKRRERHSEWESPLQQEERDTRYRKALGEIWEKYRDTEDGKRRKRELDRHYDEENRRWQEVYKAELARFETLTLRALEAEIRLRARELRDDYEKKLEKLGARESFSEVQGFDSDAFFSEREKTLTALHSLEAFVLSTGPLPDDSAEDALLELQDLAADIADPLAATQRYTQELKEKRKMAKALRSAVRGKVSKGTDAMLAECEKDDAPIGMNAMKGIQYFSKHPELLPLAERSYKEIEEHQKKIQARHAEPQSKHVAEAERLTEKKEEAFAKMQDILRKYPDECGLSIQLEREKVEVEGLLSIAKPESKETSWKLAEATWIIARIEEAADMLQRTTKQEPELLSEERFAALAQEYHFSPKARAAFIPKPHGSERIVLNAERVRNPEMRRLVVLAERAHALHHIFSEFYPTFFTELYDDLATKLPQELQGTFVALAEKWVPRTGDMTEMEWRTEVADEFMEKRLIFREFRKPGNTIERENVPLTQGEFSFFETLDKHRIEPLLLLANGLSLRPKHREFARMSNGDEDHTGADDPFAPDVFHVGADQGPTGVRDVSGRGRRNRSARETPSGDEDGEDGDLKTSDIAENFDSARKSLIKIKAFLKSNPDHGPDSADNRAYIQELEKEYETLQDTFSETPNAEADENLQQRVRELKKALKEVDSIIAKEDQRREDLRNVPSQTRGLRALWQDISFLSVYDVVRIFKDIGEDIKRQHNRRQEGKVGRVGEMITSWIPQWVPYLGNLHHDFHERVNKAELDEVEHFKKGLANVDAYEIQFMTHHTRNKDHLKACIETLIERGRMDWNDTEMWHTFNALSPFKMPIKDCERNENLKEAWLRKVISGIWSDKDNYRNWNRKNDETFTSKMKEYEPEADRLSNLKDGLAGELEKQLRVFTETKEHIKKTGHHVPLDEIIQRDLYVEVIDYAITRGKMTMEDKFFYLVQGIAEGLISANRLRIMAGVHLNIFPFIDYFYGRNNTMPEIQSLAARLRETDDIKDPRRFKPGLKTTLWLELEVAREDSVKKRLSKGMSKRGSETDHDDMGFFIPRLDYKTIHQLTTPQGGGRPQISPEGWENAYTGYNSYFKYLATLARLEKENIKGAKFTSVDAQQIMQAIAGFVRMDSIMTARSNFGDARRSGLAWGRMKTNYSVVSDGSKTVYEEQQILAHDRTGFVSAILQAYGYPEKDIADLLYSTEKDGLYHPTKAARAEELSNKLENALLKLLRENGIEPMKRVLLDNLEKFSTHGGANEDSRYDYDKIKKIKQEEIAKKQAAHAPASAPSHGGH